MNEKDEEKSRKKKVVTPGAITTDVEPGTAPVEPVHKTYYNPVKAKERRDRLMEFAKLGGYEPKKRAPGTGLTEKRTSKTGTTYYYQPWSTLTAEQKAARLAQARDRAARDREMVRKYKEEHPEEFAPKEAD